MMGEIPLQGGLKGRGNSGVFTPTSGMASTVETPTWNADRGRAEALASRKASMQDRIRR